MLNVYAQDNAEHLPCLKAVYSASDSEVLLDCKPEESKYVAYNRFKWTVNKVVGKGRAGNEIKGCIIKKGGKYYLLPEKIYDKVGGEDVIVVYVQHSNDGKELMLNYRIKVIGEQ